MEHTGLSRTRAYWLACALAALPALLLAQALSDQDVKAAIDLGLSGKPGNTIKSIGCRAGGGFGQLPGYDVTLGGPVMRIFGEALKARAKYLPFSIEQVTPEMRADTLSLIAVPQAPHYNTVGQDWEVAYPATHVVIKSRPAPGEGPLAVQPASHELVPAEWSNAAGGKFSGMGITATFTLSDLRAISTPDIDIAVITERDEKDCRISAKDRAFLK